MDDAATATLTIRGVYPIDSRPAAGVQTVKADSIDTLALHASVVGMAMLFGYILKSILIVIENSIDPGLGFFESFPMFPLAMIGGIVIQLCLERFNKRTRLIDASLMERISGSALDFLITGAIASVSVSAISNDIAPFVILIVIGLLWQCFGLYPLTKWLMPNFWFIRGVTELGFGMGIIASGLVLLRMVDPESKTPVPSDFAFKQLLHSPFMGGGIWTAIAVPPIHFAGLWVMLAICVIVELIWFGLWLFYFRPRYKAGFYPEETKVKEKNGGTELLLSTDADGDYVPPSGV